MAGHDIPFREIGPGRPSDPLTERYNREAAAYRDLWAPILKIAGSRLLREIGDPGIRRVVDVGSGVGALIPEIERAFPEASIVGVDRSPGMLGLSGHGCPRAIMEATQLALRSGSMDLALIVFVLFHVEDPLAALREARRVLRRDGLTGCLTWGQDLESNASRVWTECLDASGAAPPEPTTVTRHEPFNTAGKMKDLFLSAGFAAVRSWEDGLVTTIDKEHLLKLRTSMGSSKPRFDSLTPALQSSCIAEACHRFDGLPPEDFVARGIVVHTIAEA
jgi:SAM-dependent methyltransferase